MVYPKAQFQFFLSQYLLTALEPAHNFTIYITGMKKMSCLDGLTLDYLLLSERVFRTLPTILFSSQRKWNLNNSRLLKNKYAKTHSR